MTSGNPGNEMSAAVDAQIATFRNLQEELTKLRNDQQTLMSQHTENEMVQHELNLLDSSNNVVYKKVGPVLMIHDLSEAKQTVQKRLEFISAEMEKIEKKIQRKEQSAQDTALKVQEMQKAMQSAAVDAVNQIQQQQKAH